MEQLITIREFKMWLAGVEEMQPANWVPDDRQWAIIRNKLDTIQDGNNTHVTKDTQQLSSVNIIQQTQTEPVSREYTGPIVHAQPGLAMVTPAPPPNAALFANADNPTSAVKTPNVDTSTSAYSSAFE